jgi:hypothetical protein
MVSYLSKQTERVPMTDLSRKFGVSPLWMERCDKLGFLRMESEFVASNLKAHKNPYKLFVRLSNAKLASKLLKLPVKTAKISTKEDKIANYLLDMVDKQDGTDTSSR